MEELPSVPHVSSLDFQPSAPPLPAINVGFKSFTSIISFEVTVLGGFPGAEPELEILA